MRKNNISQLFFALLFLSILFSGCASPSGSPAPSRSSTARVVEVIIAYEPLGDDIPFAILPADLFMPQLQVRSGTFMEALLQGELVAIEGCLRVRTGNDSESRLIVWQPDYFLNDHDGTIEILDREGQVVARVDEKISIGGGEVPMSIEFESQLREPIPDWCTGPYWLMGEIVSETLTPLP